MKPPAASPGLDQGSSLLPRVRDLLRGVRSRLCRHGARRGFFRRHTSAFRAASSSVLELLRSATVMGVSLTGSEGFDAGNRG